MNKLLFLSSLLCAFATSFSPTPSLAQDRCANYAHQMVSQDQRARQTRCRGWNSHSNYLHHYNWCKARPPGAMNVALNAWGSRFQTCQFAASGSPAAQGDLARCQNYSNEMKRTDQAGLQRFCKGRGWGTHSHNHHIEWCLKQPPQRVNKAISDLRARLRAC